MNHHDPKKCVCKDCCDRRLSGKPQPQPSRPKHERKAISKATKADRTWRPWKRRSRRREAADLAMIAMMERDQ